MFNRIDTHSIMSIYIWKYCNIYNGFLSRTNAEDAVGCILNEISFLLKLGLYAFIGVINI